MTNKHLITINNCAIKDASKTYIKKLDWNFDIGQSWLITGSNSSGKDSFIKALGGNKITFVPNEVSVSSTGKGAETSLYSSVFKDSVTTVSLEEAARLIHEERLRDESEILNKEDIGRTGRAYICEVLGGSDKKGAPLPPIASRLETLPEVKLCGVENILDRGLKYMSTGEIRRTLLCRALLSGCKLLILSDPFAGLDAQSRSILLNFFNTIVSHQNEISSSSPYPAVILCMERYTEIPDAINNVLEFKDGSISFNGSRNQYESLLNQRNGEEKILKQKEKEEFLLSLKNIREQSEALTSDINSTPVPDTLIEFKDVNVGWGDHHVLINLNWKVDKGQNWLLRGPNGSGKTTILELITGDNMQVFREKIFLFGKKRGSGETIWDIKRQLGIVSYRLHVEYTMVAGTTLEDVIISGFHDSIGLYETSTDYEKALAKAWLSLAGFSGKEDITFGELSYGEQRAVLILRAAVKNPRILILDEPCHGLDENYRNRILSLIEKIAETGTTTILHVTHDPSEVLECEKHILELCPGGDPMYRIIEQ